MLSASLQSAVRAAEDGKQRFGLRCRLDRIFRRFGEERLLVDETSTDRRPSSRTSTHLKSPNVQNVRIGTPADACLCSSSTAERSQYLRVRANCDDIKDADL